MGDEVRPWWSGWAKSVRDPVDHETVLEWLPLHVHLADAAGVAGLLVDEWLPWSVVDRVAADLGGSRTGARTVVCWLAAAHDVGKLSPAFAAQVPVLTTTMREYGLEIRRGTQDSPNRRLARHERVGELAAREALGALGVGRIVASQLASVIGSHHGVPTTKRQLQDLRGLRDMVGVGAWVDARREALDWTHDLAGRLPAELGDESSRMSVPAQVLCAGIVIMADWIASNSRLFHLKPPGSISATPADPDSVAAAVRVESAWAALDLPARWEPELLAAGEGFASRFGRPSADLRPVQRATVEVATAQARPGLVIVEAPMGEGKTEAALLAVEILAARSGAGGCFVALPTRATSDAMFGRVLRWMRGLPGLPADASVMLAHSTSALNDDYRDLMRASRVVAVGEDDGEVGVVHDWLRGRKQGPLAQFVVGTVDQVLFTALRSRHLMLRHLALAGKVVVIDEVHAYDVYMSRYLDRALHWLGAYGAPVVLLSATLPAARRAELVRAYESGHGADASLGSTQIGYPVVTGSGLAPRAVPSGTSARRLRLERLDGAVETEPADLDALVTVLRDALADGGCAVVIRNTVARVQATADRLVEEFGDGEVTVAHSRFLAVDRARLDRDLLRRFGPPGASDGRPARHVVVASQVVEQSLDIDFDLMVSDLAPVDLILQRSGRLHRHGRSRPTSLVEPRLVLTGVDDWTQAPVQSVAGSRRVYGEHVLLRAAALLVDRDALTLPDDIASLVQDAYGDVELGPPDWRPAMTQARTAWEQESARRRALAETFLLGEVGGADATMHSWMDGPDVGDADGARDTRFAGQVRDGAESLEALVVQADAAGGWIVPGWVPGGGTQIPQFGELPGVLARQIAACVLRLPMGMSQLNAVGDGVVAALERNRYESFDRTPMLSKQLVLVLDGDRSAELHHGAAHFRLHYDLRRGLLTERLYPLPPT